MNIGFAQFNKLAQWINDPWGTFLNMVNPLYEVLVDIWEILSNLVSDIPYIIGLLTSFLANIPGYFSWLPSEVVSLLITAFGVVIIYMISNRK